MLTPNPKFDLLTPLPQIQVSNVTLRLFTPCNARYDEYWIFL